MGGLAFSSGSRGALETPRMPPAVYHRVRQQCIDELRALYNVVAVPVEGPEKMSHGDIDILVAEPKNNDLSIEQKAELLAGTAGHKLDNAPAKKQTDPLDAIIDILQPKAAIKTNAKDGTNSANLAIHWPPNLLPSPTEEPADEIISNILESIRKSKENGTGGTLYIQVDVRICSSATDLHWRAFKHAHGDIWNLLGTIIRPYGLTADETGLMIRVEEMEKASQKRARVFLTDRPSEVIEFLGMDKYPPSESSAAKGQANSYKMRYFNIEDRVVTGRLAHEPIWAEPFTTVREMFEYAMTCRMFWIKPESPPSSPVDTEDKEIPRGGGSHYTADPEGAPKREQLKANDRRRMSMRPVYKKWIDEFLPSLRQELSARQAAQIQKTSDLSHGGDNGVGKKEPKLNGERNIALDFPYPTCPVYTRADIRQSAFKSFPGVQERYESRLADWQIEQNANEIKRNLKLWIPEEEWQTVQWRGQCHGAFRRVLFGGGVDDFLLTERDADPEYPLRDERGVWSAENVRRFVQMHWREVGGRAGKWYAGLCREKMIEKEKRQMQEADRERAEQEGDTASDEQWLGAGEDNEERRKRFLGH